MGCLNFKKTKTFLSLILILILILLISSNQIFIKAQTNQDFNLSAKGYCGFVYLEWDKVDGADRYWIYRGIGEGNEESMPLTDFPIKENYYKDTKNLIEGKKYCYIVKAVDINAKEFAKSNEACATPTCSSEIPQEECKLILQYQIGNTYYWVNGVQKGPMLTAPILRWDRTFLIIRHVVEEVEGTISWDGVNQLVTIVTKEGKKIEFQIGNKMYKTNGVSKQIDPYNPNVVPFIQNGRTLIPLRVTGDELNAKEINWYGDKNIAELIFTVPCPEKLKGRIDVLLPENCTNGTYIDIVDMNKKPISVIKEQKGGLYSTDCTLPCPGSYIVTPINPNCKFTPSYQQVDLKDCCPAYQRVEFKCECEEQEEEKLPVLLIPGIYSEDHPGGGNTISQRVGGLKGYEEANVFLKGFYFSYKNEDHHINEIKLHLRDTSFNKDRGFLTWCVDSTFGDGGDGPFDDDFSWNYRYEVAAFPQGEVVTGNLKGNTTGRIYFSNALLPNEPLVLKGFRLDFLGTKEDILGTNDPQDHHLGEIGMLLGRGGLTRGAVYADKNYDDEFLYDISYKTLRVPDIFVVEGPRSQHRSYTPSCNIHEEILIPSEYKFATVLLQGWRFDFTKEEQDNHIQTIGLNIENERFDSNSNKLSWNVKAEYYDKEFDRDDDSFDFDCQYLIVAFKDAQRLETPTPSFKFGIFGEPDEDKDGLSDIWENDAMYSLNPYFELDEEEEWYRNEHHNVVNFVRVSSYPSKTNPEYIIFFYLVTWAKDYGYKGGLPWIGETDPHNGDTEPVIIACKVIDNMNIDPRCIWISRHGLETEIKSVNDLHYFNNVIKLFVSENKHAIYTSCEDCERFRAGIPPQEDCCGGGTFRFPPYNVGEPDHLLITGNLSHYGFYENIEGICPPSETCTTYCDKKFCGGLGWDSDAGTSILCWLFERWIPSELEEHLNP